uniref:Cystatin domain-containing protein n=1 Tax=Suricata suricatta TaxID=37032 RepID=A0A673UVJ3_SURSU
LLPFLLDLLTFFFLTETQAIASCMKPLLEEQGKNKFATFKAVEYRSQVVMGRKYCIKVQADDDEFVHIRVFESLPQENKPLALSNYQTHKINKINDLNYFQRGFIFSLNIYF